MRLSQLSLVIVPFVLASACSSAGDRAATGAETGGTIVITVGGDPDILFPPLAGLEQSRQVVDLVFDHLAEIDDELKQTIGDKGFTPRLSDHWSWAPDSLSVAFHLDPRARWHDGQPVRASDVRYTVALYKNPKLGSGYPPQLMNIDSASVRDSLTAVVWFHAHRPEAFYDVAYQIQIVPEHVFRDIPPDKIATSDAARQPIGTGRFRFVSWTPGSRVEVVSDTANYRGRAKLDRVIWAVVPDNQAALTQLLSGEADLFANVTPEQLARVNSTPSLRPFPFPALQYGPLYMNLRDPKAHGRPHPLFSDVRMRRALSMALDRRAMLRNEFDTLGRMDYGPFPRTLATADTNLRLPPFDIAHAKALLDSLGWKEGKDGMREKNGRPLAFGILAPSSSKIRMDYTVLIQDQFKRVGVRADADITTFGKFVQRLQGREFDVVLNNVTTDPSVGGANQYWSVEAAKPGGANYATYENPKFDALIDSSLASWDPTRAKQYAVKAYQLLADDAPAIWIYEPLKLGAIHKRIRTTTLRADGWWSHLADWTIPPAERIDRDRIGLRPAKP